MNALAGSAITVDVSMAAQPGPFPASVAKSQMRPTPTKITTPPTVIGISLPSAAAKSGNSNGYHFTSSEPVSGCARYHQGCTSLGTRFNSFIISLCALNVLFPMRFILRVSSVGI